MRSSPLVRKIARENNIDVAQVPGTGAGGRVSKQDILAAVEGGAGTRRAAAACTARGSRRLRVLPRLRQPPAAPSASAVLENAVPREKMYFGHYEVQPMSVMRQRIAEHMVLSKHVSPHVYSVDEADVTGIATLRAKMKEKFEEAVRHQADFHALLRPRRGRSAARFSHGELLRSTAPTSILHKECNIGIAVALDWGLIVPVIKNAEEKNFLGIARTMNDLAERARAEETQARGSRRRNLRHHQPRRLRRPVRLAGDQPAQRRHPGLGHDRKASGGD